MVCSCTDHCPAPRRCCTSCQRCTLGGSGLRRCSRSCLGFCAVHWAPGSGADQHSRQSCTVCLKTWLGETHKAVVTLIVYAPGVTWPYEHDRDYVVLIDLLIFMSMYSRIPLLFYNHIWMFWCSLHHNHLYLQQSLFSCIIEENINRYDNLPFSVLSTN